MGEILGQSVSELTSATGEWLKVVLRVGCGLRPGSCPGRAGLIGTESISMTYLIT